MKWKTRQKYFDVVASQCEVFVNIMTWRKYLVFVVIVSKEQPIEYVLVHKKMLNIFEFHYAYVGIM